MKIQLFDSTLRDGAQGEGISFSVQDKLHIAQALDRFGVDYIEAGNPGSNPKDLEFFRRAEELSLAKAKLCAFGSTRRNHLKPEEDENVKSLLAANTPCVAIFGKAWILHVTDILRITPEENLAMVEDTVAYLKAGGKEVIFDAEHFFDGCKENEEYAFSVLAAAVKGGADVLCLCDTCGGSLPEWISRCTKLVYQRFPTVRVGIHCHDDIGCAVACSMAAAGAGAIQMQGTFVGFGERCGNTDLSVLLPNLVLKCGFETDCELKNLSATAAKISEIANVRLRSNKPYVGKSAFAHKGGMHIDGVMKLPRSFEHIDPETVGNQRKFLTSEVSGRGTLLPKLQQLDPSLTKQSPETGRIMAALKEQERKGYQYEAAEAGLELFLKKELGVWRKHFDVVFFKTTDDFPASDGSMQASAILQLRVGEKEEVAGAVGNGPVNALDIALRKALGVFYPAVREMHLTDFKVRVIDQSSTTAAKVRVLIESTNGEESWTTVGVSNDIIEASFHALVDSFEYQLSKKER